MQKPIAGSSFASISSCAFGNSRISLFTMIRNVIVFLLAGAFWPTQLPQVSGRAASLDIPQSGEISSQTSTNEALTKSLLQLQRLQRRRFNPTNQGVRVETLDGSIVLADLNSDLTFNPASVMKMSTSFFALDRLGANYRFHVAVFGDSELDVARKVLKGNLYLSGDGDPVFRNRDAAALSRTLARRGLRRIEGDLVVVGPLLLDSSPTSQRSAEQIRRFLSRSGIRLTGKVRCLEATDVDLESKVHYLSHYSEKLSNILWQQNAHSINEIADRLGDSLGGPEALRQFLMEAAQLEPDEIYVARPSGLEYNRMTPRAAVKILRSLNAWLDAHQMKMQEIMPVAGVDEGTLFGRLRFDDCRGGILGKTGTNPSKDGGISSLAGIAYTRDYGPVLYTIFNTNGRISTYRRWQDFFLRNLMEECGGVGEYLPARLDPSSLYSAFSNWVPSSYWGTLPEEPLHMKKSVAKRTYIRSATYSSKAAKNQRSASIRRSKA